MRAGRLFTRAYLVLSSSLFSEGFDGRHADSQVEASDVVDLGVLHLLPDVVLLQVLKLVVVGSSKICAHRTVVTGDDDTTATSGGLLIVEVLSLDTSLLADVLKSLAVLVLANTANVEDRLGGQNVRGTSGGVLCSASSNEDGLVVLDQILVDLHVLLGVGENGVVGLEAVLLEELLITALRSEKVPLRCSTPHLEQDASRRTLIDLPDTLDIQERVLEAEQFVVSLSGHCV